MLLPESISHFSRNTLACPKARKLRPFLGQVCFASTPSQASSRQHRAARSLEETLEKHTHTFASKHSTRCWSCPCAWLLLLPCSIAKGRSWWQVLQEVAVPLLRTAVCARGQPSSHAECAICFPGLDLAYHFLLKQPVAKLPNTSICSESAQLLHGKGCSHQILSRGYKRLPLHLQSSGVTEIPHSDTHKSHPAFLPCDTGLCLLPYWCNTFHQHKWRHWKSVVRAEMMVSAHPLPMKPFLKHPTHLNIPTQHR